MKDNLADCRDADVVYTNQFEASNFNNSTRPSFDRICTQLHIVIDESKADISIKIIKNILYQFGSETLHSTISKREMTTKHY